MKLPSLDNKNERRQVFKRRFDQRAPIITESVRREICKRRAEGQTLKTITDDPDMPSQAQIYNLMWRDPSFKRMYKDARLAYIETVAEELRELAAKAADLDGVAEKKSMAHVQAIRLQVDTDKWLLSKMLAEEYGDELPAQQRGKAVGDVLDIIRLMSSLARGEKPVEAKVVVPEIEDGKTQDNPEARE